MDLSVLIPARNENIPEGILSVCGPAPILGRASGRPPKGSALKLWTIAVGATAWTEVRKTSPHSGNYIT